MSPFTGAQELQLRPADIGTARDLVSYFNLDPDQVLAAFRASYRDDHGDLRQIIGAGRSPEPNEMTGDWVRATCTRARGDFNRTTAGE